MKAGNKKDKKVISTEALKAELVILFESGVTSFGNCWEQLRTKYKMQKQRCNKTYHEAHTEWANLRKSVQDEQIVGNEEELLNEAKITRERIVAEYAKIAFFDIRKVLTVDGGLKETTEWDDESAAAIAGLESFDEKERGTGEVLGTVRKIKVSDKRAALDSLCKVLGYNSPEVVNHIGEVKIIEIPNNGRNDKAATGLPAKGVK